MTQLRLIGPAALTAHAAAAAHLLERKDAALLAMLALDGPTARPRLAALLWPEASAQAARGNLRQRLFRLRGAVGRDVVQAGATLRLLDDVAIDIAQLRERLLADPQAGQGELLAGHDYSDHDELDHWVEQARERWRATRLSLLAQVASDHESRREIAAALAYAQRMLIDEPLLEHAHRRVMRLHYLRGDRAAAMAAYETCREALGRELGLRPSAETVELARLIESSGALPQPAPAPRPIATLRPPRLVGRQAEWELAGRALVQGGCVLLAGEAGIGKTRFLDERATASAGDAAIVSGARPGDARLPYALAGRIVHALAQRFGTPGAAWAREELARIAPLLGSVPAGALAVPRLQQALTEALAAWRSAGLALLAIDDLHFADEASLELLPTLVAALRERGVPCLLALRGAETPPLLAEWLAMQDDGAALQRIALGALDPAAVRALLESLAIPGFDALSWSAPLARHTGGNPLYILETLIALLDGDAKALQSAPKDLPSPANVGALIERRLSQLSPGALRLARLAAVAGVDFSVALAAQVLECHALDIADGWRELEQALVIRDDAFAHDLIREAVLRSVPTAIARTLHEAVARCLEAGDASAVRCAPHWEAAGFWYEAGRAFRAAAASALAAARRADEAEALLAAARCFERCEQHQSRFEALLERVGALVQVAGADRAEQAALELQDLARTEVDHAQATVARSEVQIVFGDFAAVVATVPRAIETLDAADQLEFALLARRRLAVALAHSGRSDEACACLLERLEVAVTLPSLQARGEYLCELGTLLERADRREQGRELLARGIDVALQANDRSTAATACVNLGGNLYHLGHLEQAASSVERGLRLRESEHAGDGLGAGIEMTLGCILRDLGRFDTSLALLERSLQSFRTEGNPLWSTNCGCHLALLWLALGQHARAAQALDTPSDGVPAFILARREAIRAQLRRWLQGRHDQRSLSEALALFEGADRPVSRLGIQLELCMHVEPAQAVGLAQSICDEAHRRELLGLALGARIRLIEALGRWRRHDAAAQQAGVAREELAQGLVPLGFYLPELWLTLHCAYAAVNDHAAAAQALATGRAWIENLAWPAVAAPFRDSFLNRNPINRALMTRELRVAP